VAQLPTLFTTANAQSCSEQDTGTVITTLTATTGCDSVVTLTTVLVSAITQSVSLSACPGGTAVFDGMAIAAGSSQTFEYVTASGCDSIIVVSVAALPAVGFSAQTTESCWNGSNGSLLAVELFGTPPYSFSLNGGTLQAVPQFDGLAGGSYALLVTDLNGCQASASIEVPQTEPTEIKVQDRLLYCADANLVLGAEVLSGNTEKLVWKWANGSSEPTIAVSSPGNYAVSVSDGCEEQSFEIQVRLQPATEAASYFYVPNAFSPNDDQTNDGFRAYVGKDVEVRSFELQVYDRWGARLFASSDPNESWEGLHLEQDLNNSIFVWYLQATVADCKGEDLDIFKKGDVGVIR
jgi:gliding motility-associated-like protein